MIKISSSDPNLSITSLSQYDTLGQPLVEIQISAPGISDLQTRVSILEDRLNAFADQAEFDRQLIENNPALKDAYEQYRVMLNLVKEHGK